MPYVRAERWPYFWHTPQVGIQFDDLPAWEFVVNEASAGVYALKAVRNGGISGEASGSDYDGLLADLKEWAHRVENGLERDGR